jgi:hypothetical protein
MRTIPSVPRFAGALAWLSALLMAGSASAADGLAVATDQVRMVNFPQPAATVYVGNPAIADVTVVDNDRVFVLGKNFGTTNIVALDNKGNEVFNKAVTVFGRSGSTVTLQRGTAKTTYACVASRCEAAPLPGDDKDRFDAVTGQMDKRVAEAKTASSNEGQ